MTQEFAYFFEYQAYAINNIATKFNHEKSEIFQLIIVVNNSIIIARAIMIWSVLNLFILWINKSQ